MSTLDTKTKVLDAAEHLFAQNGFHATSLRAITSRAGVNLASVNYHFGSKEALLDSVIERRLVPLNRARMEMLEDELGEAEREKRRPRVKAIIRALVAPTIRFSGSGAGARNFIILVGRAISEPSNVVREGFLKLMGPLIYAMLEALGAAMPGTDRKVLVRRLHFTVGALAHTMRMCDDKDLPEEFRLACGAPDDIITGELVDFLTAGMESG